MPPKRRSQTNPQPTLTQEDIDQLVRDRIEATIRDERERVRMEAIKARGPAGGPATAPMTRECSFTGFMKCGPTQFHGTEGVVGLVRWFEKIENTFEISECAKGKKTEVKQMMTDEFCPIEEVQRLEDEVRHLKLRDMNIAAYMERFNELALLCPDAIPNEKTKVELYIKGFHEIIKGETTSSRPTTLNEAMRMAHALMEQKIQAKNKRIAEGIKRKWENNNQGNNNNNNSHNRVRDRIEATIRDERERVRMEATKARGPAGGPANAPMTRECSFTGFMKCGPTQFHGTEGVVGLVRWFEKIENTFEIILRNAVPRNFTGLKVLSDWSAGLKRWRIPSKSVNVRK
nr:hypothetical protein [Tanacetum cinerariifolium]